ncbi:WD40 repeat domain-containing serine/threonine protein kinase [Enhygromyxa salina]|uniref:WD40 repeat domain-containing serine/threonine protein kinase n=1 Tax=Enhygromyxa salina TaxID=215803 RepID=UPI0015E6F9D4|nr:WD40 repeat domain-containing serine/threonine-protein kinase [Enhygromyxa salina]
MQCPPLDELAAFLDGRASDQDRVSAHLRTCSRCSDVVAVASTQAGATVSEIWSDPDTAPPQTPGRYNLERIVGRGGQALVWAAHDTSIGREVAFKELKLNAQTQLAAARARFLHSARISARLSHPVILPVHDLGVRESGAAFYTMPLVEGETLAASIVSRPTLASRLELLPHVVDVCNAIAFAHSRGVIHRDINPANVMVGRFGETALIDWGLAAQGHGDASTTGQRDAKLTAAGQVNGTPSYMSPEQADARPTDVRTDVWGIGGLLFALATGRALYAEPSSQLAIARARTGTRPAVGDLERHTPEELVAIIDVALAFEPARRYPTAAALGADLRAFIAGREVSVFRYSRVRRLSRFVARHRGLVTAGALTFSSMAAALAVSTAAYQDERAASMAWQAAADRADQAEQLAVAASDESELNLAIAHDNSAERLRADGFVIEGALHSLAALRSLARAGPPSPEHDLIEARAISVIEGAQRRPLRRVEWRVRSDKLPSGARIVSAVSPDTGEIAVGGLPGVVRVFAAESGRELRRVPTASDQVHDLVWLPGGELAIAGPDGIELHDGQGAMSGRATPGEEGRRWLFTTPIPGALLVVHERGRVELIDDANPGLAGPRGEVAPQIEGAALLADGHTLVVSTPNPELLVWDVDTRRLLRRIPLTRPAQLLEPAPDGVHVLVGAEGWLYRVNVADSEESRFPQPFPDGFAAIAWLGDREAIIVDKSGLVDVVNTRSGDSQFKSQHGPVGSSASLVVDRGRVTVIGDDMLTQWTFDPAWDGEVSFSITDFVSIPEIVSTTCVSDGLNFMIGTHEGVWALGPPETGRARYLATDGHAVFSPERGPAGEVIAAAGDELWIWAADDALVRRHALDGPSRAARFSADGRRYAALSLPDQLIVWDASDGTRLREWTLESPGFRIALTHDGSEVAVVGKQGSVSVYDVASGERVAQLAVAERWSNLEFMPDGRLLAAGDRGVFSWSPHDPLPARLLHPLGDTYVRLSASDSGRLALADGATQSVLINMDTAQVVPLPDAPGYCLLADEDMLVLDGELSLRRRATTFATVPLDADSRRAELERDLRARLVGFEILPEVTEP